LQAQLQSIKINLAEMILEARPLCKSGSGFYFCEVMVPKSRKAYMSDAFHTVTRSLILMGLGYVPFLMFLYQVALHTGIIGSMGGSALGLPRIVLNRKYFSCSIYILQS
jgi:hypothetical protein